MSTVLAWDPDLHTPAWAWVDECGIRSAGVVEVPRKLKGSDAAEHFAVRLLEFRWETPDFGVVESQHYIDKGSSARVQNILDLALSAGQIVGAMKAFCPNADVRYLSPLTWTKGWDKETRHNRLRKRFGMDDATAAKQLNVANAKHMLHVWDAIDMALYVQAGVTQGYWKPRKIL